jgi:uncharacterized membrane protein YphA (DoxX/SURF4 family)
MNKYSATVLRIGIALVFLWFGTQQIIDPSVWTSYIPEGVVDIFSLSALKLVYLNGLFEIIFASALLLGYFTRFSALLLALHMLDITCIVGFDAVGVRDFGLAIATVAIFMHGVDKFSLDYFSKDTLERIEYRESVNKVKTS